MSEWTRPAPAECFLPSKQKHQRRFRAEHESFAGQSLAVLRDKERVRFFLQAVPNGKADSSDGRSEIAEASITQREIEEQTRRRRNQIKNQDAGNTGKISEWNERDLGDESKRNIKPRAADPCFGGVQKPERAAQSGDYCDTDHQEKFAMEMAVAVAENKKKLIGQKRGGA